MSSKQHMTPSEAFVETLVAQGVKDVFGIVGSAFMDALDLFPAAGIRFVPTVHEPVSYTHLQGQAIAAQPLLTIERIGEADPRPLPKYGHDPRPLQDIRVLDLTRIIAGPVCGRALAAYGADVMLVNSPHLPNIANLIDTSRGKLSVHADLDTADGRIALANLLRSAHVLVQGYRPGGMAALGFGPQDAARLRPGIVYVSLTAYGLSLIHI